MYFVTDRKNIAQDVASHNSTETQVIEYNGKWVVEIEESNQYAKNVAGEIVGDLDG